MAAHIRRVNLRLFSTGKPKLVYIPRKTKEEILALNEEDSARWNASTLSTRFSAPRENVEAILRLGELRKRRENVVQSLEKDERERVIQARDRAISEWNKLIESVPSISTRGLARPSELKGPAVDVGVKAKTEEEGQETGESKQEDAAVEESEDAEAVGVKKSAWAKYVEKEVDNFEPDVTRGTTYAFIEVGDEKEELQRAVWMREGNGKMRIASDVERKLLLNEEGARTSTAWL